MPLSHEGELWTTEEQLPQGGNVGREQRKEADMWTAATTSSQYRGDHVHECVCVFEGRCSAATSTAQHDRHYSEERVREGCCFGEEESDTTKMYWERKRQGRLTELRRLKVEKESMLTCQCLTNLSFHCSHTRATQRTMQHRRKTRKVQVNSEGWQETHLFMCVLSTTLLYCQLPLIKMEKLTLHFLFQATGGRPSECLVEQTQTAVTWLWQTSKCKVASGTPFYCSCILSWTCLNMLFITLKYGEVKQLLV